MGPSESPRRRPWVDRRSKDEGLEVRATRLGARCRKPSVIGWRLTFLARREVQMRGLLVTSMCILLAATPGIAAQQPGSEGSQVSALGLRAPAAGRPTRIDPSGETVLPNGRLVTPRGKQVKVAPHPYGLALSPDGKTVVTANSGTAPFSVSIVTDLASAEPKVAQIPPGVKPAEGELDSVFMGVAIAPDNRTLYVAEGDNGCVGIFDLVTHERLGRVSLDGAFQGKSYAHSLSGELKLSPDGHSLY